MDRLIRTNGFTLVELAVVTVLIGIVMTLGLKTLNATLGTAAFSETKAKQERIKIALIGYLRTHGVLPCPDSSSDSVVASGESIACTTPDSGYGVVPWITLEIPRETVIDGWGNYFTYRVANGSGGSRDWTSKTTTSAFTINELMTQTDALTIQELNADGSALVDVTKKAVVAIVSHGKNGFGAKTMKVGARMPTDDAGAGEKTNATVGTATFVMRPGTESAAAFNGPYDDLVAFMKPQDLLQPLINEGTLKACAAYCTSAVSSVCSNTSHFCTCSGSGLGLPGLPDGSSTAPCSGGEICGTCSATPITSNCSPTGPIPVGATPASCTTTP